MASIASIQPRKPVSGGRSKFLPSGRPRRGCEFAPALGDRAVGSGGEPPRGRSCRYRLFRGRSPAGKSPAGSAPNGLLALQQVPPTLIGNVELNRPRSLRVGDGQQHFVPAARAGHARCSTSQVSTWPSEVGLRTVRPACCLLISRYCCSRLSSCVLTSDPLRRSTGTRFPAP